MFAQKKTIFGALIISLLVMFSLVGCFGSSTDKAQIMQIAENVEKALEKKKVDLFMENISYNYSDSNGGTYDNHINHLSEEIIAKIEDAEDLIDPFFIFKIDVKVNIPEGDLVIADIYANGKMEITISLKACIAWVICTILYNEIIEYDVDFKKEDDNWKIISLIEI